jgi:hypothetical protein
VIDRPAAPTRRLSLILDLATFVQPAQAPSNPATRSIAAPADLAHSPPLIPTTSLILRI